MNKVQCKSKGWQHILCCRKMTRTEPGCSWWEWWGWEGFFLRTPRGFLKLVLLQWTIFKNCQWIFTFIPIDYSFDKISFIECLEKANDIFITQLQLEILLCLNIHIKMTNAWGFKYNHTGLMGVSVRGFSDPGCVLDNSSLYTQTSRYYRPGAGT